MTGLGRCDKCYKLWLRESGDFKGDEKAFKKENSRLPLHCDCRRQGNIVLMSRMEEINELRRWKW